MMQRIKLMKLKTASMNECTFIKQNSNNKFNLNKIISMALKILINSYYYGLFYKFSTLN